MRSARQQMPNSNSANPATDPNNIQVFTFVQAVRRRPRMYIDSVDAEGLSLLVYLAAVEAVEGPVLFAKGPHAPDRATRIDIVLHGDNSVTVRDNGGGLPVEEHEDGGERAPLAQMILTTGYVPSRNGGAIVNALSEQFDVVIWRDGQIWEQTYSKGDAISALHRTGEVDKHGTTFHFRPDKSIFSVTHFDFDCVVRVLSKFVSEYDGVLVTLTDQRQADAATHLPRRVQFQNTTP